ncbi:uncharacterized protein LOC123527177 isoform X3 [Mercenaria mercenaria]|uniref:uncharacterized protein LOC123527177 isoform X3 n=1 Tax=Mercenaria mercenaria TaxID=6596 RepID=UPI00234F1354|nr:uncharacterized protein LOC123527177 isoform X3 [Mercenaria mercenaria]
MSLLLRQLCVCFIVILVLNYSEGFSIGYGKESDDPEGVWNDALIEDKRSLTDYNYVLYPQPKRRRPSYKQRNFAAPRGKRVDEAMMNTYLEPQGLAKDSSRLRIGRSMPLETQSVPEEDQILDEEDKINPYIRMERAHGDKTFLRIGRSPSDSGFLRIGRAPFLRIGRSPFLRIGRSPFLRIGRSPFLRIGRSPFLRIGRSPFLRLFHDRDTDKRSNDQGFLRIGRNSDKRGFLRIGRPDKTFLRIGRAPTDQTFLRIGRSNEMTNEDPLETTDGSSNENSMTGVEIDTGGDMGKRENSNGLTPEELQLLMANKDLLLEYMERHPDILDGSQEDVDDDAYFAFPRQGRAMSFYFPRMGRSGEDSSKSAYCCEEGVRRVFTVGKGSIEICGNEKTCCPGFVEQTKVYKDIVITECAEESGLDKIRAYIDDE